jgi:hypothetical protein
MFGPYLQGKAQHLFIVIFLSVLSVCSVVNLFGCYGYRTIFTTENTESTERKITFFLRLKKNKDREEHLIPQNEFEYR